MKKVFLILGVSFFTASIANATDYKSVLTGKTLYMRSGNCAGLSLTKNSGLMGDQSPCKVDLPARLKWIDNDTFIMIEKNQTLETSPPRTFLYKVKSLQGNKIVLSEIWTGWNNYPDTETTYTIK